MGIVVFNPEEFRQEYPEYSDVTKYTDAYLNRFFKQACLICNNTEMSVVPYDPERGEYERQTLLYLLVCHMLELAGSGKTGTLTSATEGSVSASFYIETRKGAGWFQQTQCGYTYWKMVQKYRVGGIFVSGAKRH